MLPGIVIKNNESLMCKILHRINPGNVAPIIAMRSWKITSIFEFINEIKKDGNYYVLYKHPIHKKKDSLSQATREELIGYVSNKINPERGEGVDIIVVSSDFDKAFIFNHDGDVFKAPHYPQVVGVP